MIGNRSEEEEPITSGVKSCSARQLGELAAGKSRDLGRMMFDFADAKKPIGGRSELCIGECGRKNIKCRMSFAQYICM